MELTIRNKAGIRFGALKGEIAQYYLKDIACNAKLFKATTKKHTVMKMNVGDKVRMSKKNKNHHDCLRR